jgi:hypothetical protein
MGSRHTGMALTPTVRRVDTDEQVKSNGTLAFWMETSTAKMSREDRRKAMPVTAEVVDAFQEAFGPVVGIEAIEKHEKTYTFIWNKR